MPEKAVETLKVVLAEIEKEPKSKVGEMEPSEPKEESAQMLLARSYLRLNQPRKALPILEKLSRDFDGRYGNSPNARSYIVSLSMAKALQGVGRYRDSIKHLKKFLDQTETKSSQLHAQRIFALYWIVDAYLKTGDFSKALEVASRIRNDHVAQYGTDHWVSSCLLYTSDAADE